MKLRANNETTIKKTLALAANYLLIAYSEVRSIMTRIDRDFSESCEDIQKSLMNVEHGKDFLFEAVFLLQRTNQFDNQEGKGHVK